MTEAKTLMQLSGADLSPSKLKNACVVLIDMQNEYLEGPIAVTGAAPAVEKAAGLLAAAREAGAPVIHVAHKGAEGGLFDRDAPRGAIIPAVAPKSGETVVEKGLPNAFAGTTLLAAVERSGRREIILAGFMTHMCVSSTARAALDLGFRVTVDAEGCATRDLPDGKGGMIEAGTLHEVALVELSDRFAVVARGHDWR